MGEALEERPDYAIQLEALTADYFWSNEVLATVFGVEKKARTDEETSDIDRLLGEIVTHAVAWLSNSDKNAREEVSKKVEAALKSSPRHALSLEELSDFWRKVAVETSNSAETALRGVEQRVQAMMSSVSSRANVTGSPSGVSWKDLKAATFG